MAGSFTDEYLLAYYEFAGKKDLIIIDNMYEHYKSCCLEFSKKDAKIVAVTRNSFGARCKATYDTKRTTARIQEMGGAVKPVYKGIRFRTNALQLKKIGAFWVADQKRTINDNKYAEMKINPELVRDEFLKVYGELNTQLEKSTDERDKRSIVKDMADILDKLAKLCGAYKDDQESREKMNHLDNVLNTNYQVNKNIAQILKELCKSNPNG